MLPQERVLQHAALQIVHVPVPQTQEQSAVTVNSQFPITAVEASQVVDSYSLSEEFAAPDEVTTFSTSSTSTSSQKPLDAEEDPESSGNLHLELHVDQERPSSR